jgi:Family of unknown function (DUF6603)
MAEASKKPGIFRRIINWFKYSAEWVMETIADEDIGAEIREDLGLSPTGDIPEAEKAKLPAFAKDLDPDQESFAETAAEIEECATVLLAIADAAKNEQLSAYDTMLLLGTFTANESIRLKSPFFFALGQLMLILRDDPEELGRLDPANLVTLLRGEAPRPGGAELFHQRLFATMPILMEVGPVLLGKMGIHLDRAGIDMESYYGWDPAPDSPTPEADLVSMRALTLIFSLPSAPAARLALTVLSVPRTHGGPGVFLSVGGSLSFDTVLDGTRYRLSTGGSGAFDLFIGPSLGSIEGGGDPEAFIRFDALRTNPDVPAFRLGEADHSRLDVGAMQFGIELSGKGGGLSWAFQDAALIIKLGEADGFLKTLSKKELALRFDFGIVLDSDGGLHLAGGTKAAVTLPVANSVLGAITVHHADLRLGKGKQPDDFGIELSAALAVGLGPFRASVDRIGLLVEGGFRDGNLGFLDLAAGFRAPDGIGLVLDTKHVKGGGYLFLDRDRGEYAGVLDVKLGPIQVKAIGLLQTSTSGGDDWSLLIFLFGQFPPVPLLIPGLNWSGVGGMMGVRRGVDVEKLQTAARLGALDDILFPQDPVADAPRLINELRTVFPYTVGAFTIGAFLELGYLKPQVAKLRVGVIVECNRVEAGSSDLDPVRVLILGQIIIDIPIKKKTSAIKIICDVVGIVDTQAKSFIFSARLRDSKVLSFTLTGMLVLRDDYGEKPAFVLAAGGFHPDFKEVPTGLPAPIDRLGIEPIKFKGFQLEVAGYFAITPNTMQFGIAGKLKGKLGPVSAEGSLVIDALINDEPYRHFIVSVKFVAAIKYKGHNLAGVKVDAKVEGPGYWHVVGTLTFEILWWDFDIPFDGECGDKPDILGEDINLGELVRASLADESAWEPQLPPDGEALVTIAPAVRQGTFVHPLAGLNVVQRVAPLGVDIQRYGSARVTGAHRFDVTAVRLGDLTLANPPALTQPFGRGQYFDLTDEQRLTLPSFEPFAAGVTVAGGDFGFGSSVGADLEFETAYLELDPQAPRGRLVFTTLAANALPQSALEWQPKSGGAARSLMRERARAPAGAALKLSVASVPLVAVETDTLVPSQAVVLTGQAAVSPTAAAEAVMAAGGGVTFVEAF